MGFAFIHHVCYIYLTLALAGIYDGDEEKVIHLTPRQAGQEYSEPRGVLFTRIDDFLDGGRLYLFEYGVNPVLFLAKLKEGLPVPLLSIHLNV